MIAVGAYRSLTRINRLVRRWLHAAPPTALPTALSTALSTALPTALPTALSTTLLIPTAVEWTGGGAESHVDGANTVTIQMDRSGCLIEVQEVRR